MEFELGFEGQAGAREERILLFVRLIEVMLGEHNYPPDH